MKPTDLLAADLGIVGHREALQHKTLRVGGREQVDVWPDHARCAVLDSVARLYRHGDEATRRGASFTGKLHR